MEVLALIPARGGSKGVPRKNARLLGGRPLIEWTIATALASRRIASVIVSTDDEELAAIAVAAGASVPFLRPADLAGDAVPTLPVVQHALEEAPGATSWDAVCLLQPTSPFRAPDLVDRAIDLMGRCGADSVLSVLPVPHHHHPDWALLADGDGLLRWANGNPEPPPRRQDLRPAFHREGSLYLTRTEVVRSGSLYGATIAAIEVDPQRSVNIDTLDDWEQAERLVDELRLGPASRHPHA